MTDRYPRERVLVFCAISRMAIVGGAAIVFAFSDPLALVYLFGAVDHILGVLVRPATGALLPFLARKPKELTATNIVATVLENANIFIGPIVGVVLFTVFSPSASFVFAAVVFLVVAFLFLGVKPRDVQIAESKERSSALMIYRQLFEGFRTIARSTNMKILLGFSAVQAFVHGLFLNVLIIVSAIELLDLGDQGPGLLIAAVGLGGAASLFATFPLIGRHHYARILSYGMILWGAPIMLIGIFTNPFIACLASALFGFGRAVTKAVQVTLWQRSVSNEMLGRVMGADFSFYLIVIALGSIVAPLLIDLLGLRGALIATGAILPVFAIIGAPGLVRIDRTTKVNDEAILSLIQIPVFAPLSIAITDRLASSLVSRNVNAGDTLIHQGDSGDSFYVIDQGNFEAIIDNKTIRKMSNGDHFGEIALLRDVPRTATVRAISNGTVWTLDRRHFLAAVTGNPDSKDVVESVVRYRLGE
jgi:MFS family permease